MKQLQDLVNTGVYETYTPKKAMTVQDLLVELDLSEDKLFSVLVNGKKVSNMNHQIGPEDEISIIPIIAGGGKFMETTDFMKLSFQKKSEYLHGLHRYGQQLVRDCWILINVLIKKGNAR